MIGCFKMRGGERCLEVLLNIFPDADLYTLFYKHNEISKPLVSKQPKTSVLNKLPKVEYYYRYLLPLYPVAVRDLSKQLMEQSELGNYELVISISHCVAKNIEVPKSTIHLCYCLTPMRYLWDQYDAYFSKHPAEPIIRNLIKPLRDWDIKCSEKVDYFVAISDFVSKRIKRVYNRHSKVIYPPVKSDWISPRKNNEKGNGFLAVNALVPYKNVKIIVEAFNQLGLELIIVGTGPEEKRLKALAGKNISFLGRVSDFELATLYRNAKALVFAAEEDFGMTPVEAQAAGRPVIAFGKGGVLETVVYEGMKRTGVFFSDLNARSLASAVQYFLDQEESFTVDNCISNAKKFSCDCFEQEFFNLLDKLKLRDVKKILTAI
jgi:glycosyltransferase involved in cell wall biosynthesis